MPRRSSSITRAIYWPRLSRPLALGFVLALAMAGCAPAQLTPLPPNGVILAYGDSLTAGVGVTADHSYPRVLAELTGLEVKSSGVPGETTTDGLARLPAVLQQHNPDLVVLLEGGNDILRGHNLAKTKSNLAAMIRLVQNRGATVVLIGVPERRLFSQVAPLYRELAEEHQVVLIDTLLSDLLRDARYKSDPVHLNEAGYRAMAEAIVATLQDSGAL